MNPIYLDYAATTPMRPEVREVMLPCLEETFGNPSSVHRWGREAQAALERARGQVAKLLGARHSEVFFVRGGTESDNLAVLGRAAAERAEGRPPLVVYSAVEHKAVIQASGAVERDGGRRVALGISPDGSLDMDALDEALEQGPALVSVMAVNNETGLVLPLLDVVRRCRSRDVPVHSDAVQAVGKVALPTDGDAPHLLTLSGHKIYGPKGTGVLVVRGGLEVRPLLHGGGQERELRPGTEDVAGAVGLAEALRLALEEREVEAPRLRTLRKRLEDGLVERIEGLRIHGAQGPRAPHVVNVGVPGMDTSTLLINLDLEGIAASGGSACSSGSSRGSHVLRALYGEEAEGVAAIRFSLGRGTTEEEVDRTVETLAVIVDRVRSRVSA